MVKCLNCENELKTGKKYCSRHCYMIVENQNRLKNPNKLQKLVNNLKLNRKENLINAKRIYLFKLRNDENFAKEKSEHAKERFKNRKENDPEWYKKVCENNKRTAKMLSKIQKLKDWNSRTYIEKYGVERALDIASKISKSNKGGKMGDLNPMRRPEVIAKISGPNHPQWNNGSSFEPYGREFNKELRESIRIRDQYRCQQCFRHQDEVRTKSNRKYRLSIHHIDYNKKNNNPDNLISLCRNCHEQTNFNRNNWIEYFRDKNIKRDFGGNKNDAYLSQLSNAIL